MNKLLHVACELHAVYIFLPDGGKIARMKMAEAAVFIVPHGN